MNRALPRPNFLAWLSVLGTAWAAATCGAGRTVTWVGGNGAWEDNNNWSDGTIHPLQPFDPDAAVVPSGFPVISFVEGINTLSVATGAGITQNGSLSVHNGVVNNGVITVSDDGQFGIDAGVLEGSGETVLADSTGTFATIAFSPSPNACCAIHSATHTIRGEGAISGQAINDGLIRAEETSGDATALLAITNTMTNNGVIRSSATGSIYLTSLNLTMGATGRLIADGQPIQLGPATIIGGSIDAINGGKFVRRADVGGATVLSGVTLNGDLDVLVTNAGVVGTGAGIINNGTMTIDNLGVANAELSMTAGSTLGGTGQVVLNRANDSVRISGEFTHGANHTIRGVGRVQAAIVNNGSILAEPKNGGSLLRIVGNSITNNNLLQANDGATLRLEQEVSVTQSAAGRLRAASGGVVELINNATITGGRLQSDGTGVVVTAASNRSILVGVTNEGTFYTAAGATTRIGGASFTNNGTMTINPSGANALTSLEVGSSLTISGSGSILLNQSGNSARVSFLTGSEVVTQAAGHTIHGRGLIDNGFGSGRFVNNGRLEGDSASATLSLFTRLSGAGALKDVTIGGGFVQIQHILGETGTTAIVPAEGLYNFARNSSLVVDLAGTTPGAGYDQLSSTGTVALSSTATRLEVSLAGHFVPAAGDMFSVVTTTGSLTGTFGAVVLPTGAPNFAIAWKPVRYTPNAVVLEVQSVTGLPGDYNGDGVVNAADYTVWRDGRGATGLVPFERADGDGDGDIDQADYTVWAANYGRTATGPANAVPEPGAYLLFCVAACAVGASRRTSASCGSQSGGAAGRR